jgi:hypothetical protein
MALSALPPMPNIFYHFIGGQDLALLDLVHSNSKYFQESHCLLHIFVGLNVLNDHLGFPILGDDHGFPLLTKIPNNFCSMSL